MICWRRWEGVGGHERAAKNSAQPPCDFESMLFLSLPPHSSLSSGGGGGPAPGAAHDSDTNVTHRTPMALP